MSAPRRPRPGRAPDRATVGRGALAALLLAAAAVPGPGRAQADTPGDRGRDGAAGDTVADRRPLVTDRPDFTESARAVRRLQLEAGYTRIGGDPTDTHRLGEALVRVPAVPRLELRVGVPSLLWEAGGAADGGLGDASLGAKLELARGGGGPGRPELAVLAGTSLPVGDRGAEGPVPEVRLAAGAPLADRVGIGVNLGAARPEDAAGRYVEMVGSLALGVEAGGGLGVYAEVYGLEPTGGRPAASFVDGGLTWGIGPDVQLDARVAAPVAGEGREPRVGVGLSLRR